MTRIVQTLATAALMAFALAASTAPSHAYACMNSPHQAISVKKLKATASVGARQNWTSSASSQYGLSWSVWPIAKARTVDCVHLNNGDWRCLASGKPCNYVVP